jgi:glycosyltransferase involved in cell wall biosynthesis
MTKDFIESGISVLESPWGIHSASGRVRTVLHLAAALRTHSPDLLHTHLPAAHIIGSLASFFSPPITRIMSRRGLPTYRARRPLAGVFERALHHFTDFHLANSRAVARTLSAEGVHRERIGIIANGVEIPMESDHASRSLARSELSLSEGCLVFLSVANLIPYKGHKDLLHAFAQIKSSLPKPWRLICTGRDDGIGQGLKSLSKELGLGGHVVFTGEIADLTSYYQAADILLLASHEEGFSNAVLESMAHGLPVVATDVGGNSEAIIQGADGILVPPVNPEKLGEAICALANDATKREQIGKAARLSAETRFSMPTCVSSYRKFYESVLRGTGVPLSLLPPT